MHPIVDIKPTQCRTTKLVDAHGRDREIATGKCPCCSRGLFIIVKHVLGMHMTHAEALYLIEALRQGAAFQLLRDSPILAGRKFLAMNVTGGRWLLGYDVAGAVCDFLCSGDPRLPSSVGRLAVAFTVEQREKFADVLFADLMENATEVARA